MLGQAAKVLPAPAYALLHGGYLAVTTFFTLSGFVLARSYAGTPWTPANLIRYGMGRVARVYPVYLLSLAVVVPFIVESRVSGKAALVAAHGLLLQGWLGRLGVAWNTPAWSLSCEMFFYACFPAAIVFLRGAGWRKTILAAAAACAMTRVLVAVGVNDSVKPLIHLSDFVMGIAAACAFDLLRETGRPPRGAWVFGPAAAASVLLIAYPGLLPGGLDLNSALRPLNALLVVGLALGGAGAGLLSGRAAVFLGKASYAMYILHVPVFWWYARLSRSPAAGIYVAAVIAVSALVYRYFEEPANRRLRAVFAAHR
jgi:peptidoglycan/LPS O-acetylase OafA/YrhL